MYLPSTHSVDPTLLFRLTIWFAPNSIYSEKTKETELIVKNLFKPWPKIVSDSAMPDSWARWSLDKVQNNDCHGFHRRWS